MCSMSLALTAVIHQKCICRGKQQSFSASVDSRSVRNASGSSFTVCASSGTRSSLNKLLDEELQVTGCTSPTSQ